MTPLADSGGPQRRPPLSPATEDVLVAVALIPPGRVVSYGDLADLVGTGARRVGAILRDHGADVPWWRVVNHRGRHPLGTAATPHWLAEAIIPSSPGCCRLTEYRADLAALATEWEGARQER